MFKDSNFDVLEFIPPANGMNRNISKDILPNNFAYVFENVLSIPVGETSVRYGTRLINQLLDILNYNYTLEAFPFQKTNGGEQIVCYFQYFVNYIGATNTSVLDADKFFFTPNDDPDFFIEEDTYIKIEYSSSQGLNTVSTSIKNVEVQLNGDIAITLKSELFPSDAEIESFSFSRGKIQVYDIEAQDFVAGIEKSNLHVGVVPRSVTYLSELLICNGVDRNLKWDGTTLEEIYDFVKEQALSFNRIDDTHFTFTSNAAFDITKYQNENNIQLIVDGASYFFVVVNIEINEGLITITTDEDLPEFNGQSRIELFYKDYPPAFSFMHVAHDRIFALPPGSVNLQYRNSQDALRVYYTYRVNSLTNWFNENTKTVPSIDISAKHEVPDNLEAIISLNEYIAFCGRKRTQVWIGKDPSSVDDFQFSSLIPEGIFHGNLIIGLPNDTYFISPNGTKSFGTLNIARQFASTSVDAVDPLVRKFVESSNQDNYSYRLCRSFKYNFGSFCGFKIGLNSVLIGVYSTNIYSWSLFSGDFKFSSTFLSTLNNSLYLFIDNKIYQYADSISGVPVYGDDNGQNFINFIWSLPTTQLKGRKFSNNYYELDVSYSSDILVNKKSNIAIPIDGDIPENFSFDSPYSFQIRGDLFETIPLLEKGEPDPNSPLPEDRGMRLDTPYERIIERFKFISSKFLVTIFGQTQDGPLSFKKLKLFGRIEKGR